LLAKKRIKKGKKNIHSHKIFYKIVRQHYQMSEVISIDLAMAADQNESINEAVKKNKRPLFDFIRNRVADVEDAQDILQDVFYELTEAYRLMQPIEKIPSWLFRVARNKIIDLYRKKKTESLESQKFHSGSDEENELFLEDLLASPDASPVDELQQSYIWDAIGNALDELPPEQREVFVQHELEGRSFNEISEITGVAVNTLLSRKRYAVLDLRNRLQYLYDEM